MRCTESPAVLPTAVQNMADLFGHGDTLRVFWNEKSTGCVQFNHLTVRATSNRLAGSRKQGDLIARSVKYGSTKVRSLVEPRLGLRPCHSLLVSLVFVRQ